MASVKVNMPSAFMEQISKMSDKVDAAIPMALEEGGKIARDKMHGNLASVIGRNTKWPSRSTGKLLGALGLSPVKRNDEGNYDVKVGFSEGRPGKSNAMLANILEYGKSGQPPKPFLKPTKTAVRQQCLDRMKAVLEQELKTR